MKTFTTAVFFFSIVSTAFAQEIGKPDRFQTMDACKAAVKSGDFTSYVASFMNNHREPRQGEEVRPLEERGCVDLRIVGGRGFVPQVKGEKYIFRGAQIIARYDCGNEAWGIEYVPPPLRAQVYSPPQQVVVEIKLPVHQTFELLELVPFSWIDIPPLPAAPPPGMAIVLVWDRGRPKWSYIPILNCIYQLGPNIGHDWNKVWPDIERGACIAGGVYAGLALTAGVVLYKTGEVGVGMIYMAP